MRLYGFYLQLIRDLKKLTSQLQDHKGDWFPWRCGALQFGSETQFHASVFTLLQRGISTRRCDCLISVILRCCCGLLCRRARRGAPAAVLKARLALFGPGPTREQILALLPDMACDGWPSQPAHEDEDVCCGSPLLLSFSRRR